MAATLTAMFKAAALAALLLAAPAAAEPVPYDSYRGAPDLEPPPPPPSDELSRLNQLLPEKEPDTFAGLWVTSRDTSTIAIAFTRNAAATLAKYTRNPRFKPVTRPGPSQRELYATQERLMGEFARLGARPMGAWSDIREGRVKIEIFGEMGGVKAAIARGELTVPPYVDVIGPPPIKHPALPPPPAGYVSPVKAFPRFAHRGGGPEIAILRTGRALLIDGCLRLEGERQSPVIVWPNEAALDLSHGDVRVFHRMSGEAIVPGEQIIIGGSSGPLQDEAEVLDADPACPGPYVHLTGFAPYAPLEAQFYQRQIEDYAREHKVTLAEARRVLDAQGRRNNELRVFGSTLQTARPDLFGEMQVSSGKATLKLAGDPPPGLIPAAFAPDITVQRVPRPLAELAADRNRFLDQVEALGLKAGAAIDIDRGAVTIQSDDFLALSRAVTEGRLTLPPHALIYGNGAPPAGYPGEWNLDAAWKALEAAPDFAAVRKEVAARPQSFYGDAPQPVSPASALEIARYLVMLGFTADEIRDLRAVGVDPVAAWVEQNGRATPANQAVLADNVIVAEALSVDTSSRALNDGARSTVRFRVLETLKGTAAPGEVVTVRMNSGLEPDGTYAHDNMEPPLLPGLPQAVEPGRRYLVYLSRGQYAHAARVSGYQPRDPDWSIPRLGPLLITDDGAIQASYAQTAPATLAEVRAAVAPVQAAFEKAGVTR